jgi:hypothetical protein
VDLIVSPGTSGLKVQDADRQLPASTYQAIEEAEREAGDFLAGHGGGRLLVREGDRVLSERTVHGLGG